MILRRTGDTFEAEGSSYRWRWSTAGDEVTLSGSDGGRILTHRLQPHVEVAGAPTSAGRIANVEAGGSQLQVCYEGVNGRSAIELSLRFRGEYYVLDRVIYEPAADEAIVRIDYLSGAAADMCVVPGGRQDPEQYLFRTADLEDVTFSIGCFGMGTGTFHQQWALPHYLLACYGADGNGMPSSAACIGLGAAPDGNVLVRADRGHFSYEVNLRSDLWGHRRGPQPQRFDVPLMFAVAPDWYQAGRAYFEALIGEGYARRKRRADVPAAAFWPQYDTWGDQAARRCILHLLTEEHLRAMYDDFRASGLRARLFVIDDKWEGVYGSLEHDADRFPHFVELLDEIRTGGCEIGLWTAFPRCEDFRALGLAETDVLVQPDGTPYVERQHNRSWYVFDPTSERAAAHLRDRAHHLVRTYRPKLVKIDFGYEIPTPDIAGPHDPSSGGERLFLKFLEVIAGALKEADPEVAVLYYCLSPLFNDYIDQCGADDLWMSRGAYDEGFAKRALLSSWCGATGLAPYGSSGYDWRSAAEIWFDTAIIGSPGVIVPLAGDEYGDRPTPDLVARYNGIARIARSNPLYRVQLLDAELQDATAGPRARSWLRLEGDEPVVAALRPAPGATVTVPGLLEAGCRVVVASLTDDGLGATPRLGIVPFGEGTLRIKRTGTAHAIAHLLGGGTVRTGAQIEGDWLALDVTRAHEGGEPVELIELAFASMSG